MKYRLKKGYTPSNSYTDATFMHKRFPAAWFVVADMTLIARLILCICENSSSPLNPA
jgi:hypothetical protein